MCAVQAQPRQKRSLRSQQRLIASAQQLLNAAGENEVGIPEIAAAADLSVGAIYKHFPSKTALLDAVHRDYQARRNAFVRETFPAEVDAALPTVEARIRFFLDAFAYWYRENGGVLRSFIRSWWSGAPKNDPYEAEEFSANIEIIATFIAGGAKRKMTPPQWEAAKRGVCYALLLYRDLLVVDIKGPANELDITLYKDDICRMLLLYFRFESENAEGS